ncbi:MAG: AAA family ATPase [Tannerellaceae bacterium]|jgi:predicted AAA+ superfamily ATPase|nr:AAA family ATPase [Tannerellaceae bacterium]
MFERPYLKQVKARIEEPRKFILVIMGPRQVGKTTMVTQLLSRLFIPVLNESGLTCKTPCLGYRSKKRE